MSEVANVYTDEHGRKFQYRLTENVYAPDEHGVLRLVERVPVPDDAYIADGELLLFAQSDGGYVDGTDLLTGDNPKFTLTEDPMHDESAECRKLRAEVEEWKHNARRYRKACWGLLWLLFTVVTIGMGLVSHAQR